VHFWRKPGKRQETTQDVGRKRQREQEIVGSTQGFRWEEKLERLEAKFTKDKGGKDRVRGEYIQPIFTARN